MFYFKKLQTFVMLKSWKKFHYILRLEKPKKMTQLQKKLEKYANV